MSATGFYPYYDNVPRIFGIDLEMDQQLAGLMMWVGGSMIYLLWITVIFLTWASREEAADREPRRPPSVPCPGRGRMRWPWLSPGAPSSIVSRFRSSVRRNRGKGRELRCASCAWIPLDAVHFQDGDCCRHFLDCRRFRRSWHFALRHDVAVAYHSWNRFLRLGSLPSSSAACARPASRASARGMDAR